MRVIISGGGTGGHIFPAISIADELKQRFPDAEILFVGAEHRMEMTRVPQAGYDIKALPISGFQRKLSLENVKTLFRIFKSLRKSKEILTNFKPDIAIGVGGYASGPLLYAAQKKKIPTLIQEQNSYAGITNKILAKQATKICVAYDNMERFFPKDRIVFTGNPIRPAIQNIAATPKESYSFFGLDSSLKTIVVVGGSLGARTLNESVEAHIETIKNAGVQVVWQTGKAFYQKALQLTEHCSTIKVYDFIQRMDYAYTVADIIVSRAGAGTISELCVVGKPCIFVPSPNVSEDHQTKNAQALVSKQAARMIPDNKAQEELFATAIDMLNDSKLMEQLSERITQLATPRAAQAIVDEITNMLHI